MARVHVEASKTSDRNKKLQEVSREARRVVTEICLDNPTSLKYGLLFYKLIKYHFKTNGHAKMHIGQSLKKFYNELYNSSNVFAILNVRSFKKVDHKEVIIKTRIAPKNICKFKINYNTRQKFDVSYKTQTDFKQK